MSAGVLTSMIHGNAGSLALGCLYDDDEDDNDDADEMMMMQMR